MSVIELPAAEDLSALANELEHNEQLHAVDGRDSYPVDWVSRVHIRPTAIYVEALRIAARAMDREAIAKICGAYAQDDERTGAIQRYLFGR
jgi:hypothetical protein